MRRSENTFGHCAVQGSVNLCTTLRAISRFELCPGRQFYISNVKEAAYDSGITQEAMSVASSEMSLCLYTDNGLPSIPTVLS